VTVTRETERVTALARRLTDATNDREVKWQKSAADRYRWTSAAGSVSVASSDGDRQPPYELIVSNADGEEVDKLVSALVSDDQPAPWNDGLADLYRAARRSALGADELIDALMAQLPPERADRAERSLFGLPRKTGGVRADEPA
jgi:hypothetical protein